MAVYKGLCKICGTDSTIIIESTDQCLTCTRLDNIEKKIGIFKEIKRTKKDCPYKTICRNCGYYRRFTGCKLGYEQ